ncbi:MAG: aspartate/glutamate racemase [Frankiales bacterium]|nr:aspartate/glutamate racemase [Frankiales bacterium]
MLTIGLLGGMSWESTAEYHRLANTLVRERLGGLHSARLVLVSVDLEDVAVLQRDGRWTDAGALLAREARRVEAAGADLLLLCTNTMHVVADQVAEAVSIPLLHLADVTADAVLAAGAPTVGLLGTAHTMEQPFYRDRLARHGIEVVVPDAPDRALVHRVIFDELCQGVVSPASREALLGVVDRLAGAGARGVVLGCTELELLLRQEHTQVPLFATTRLHVEAAVRQALAGEPGPPPARLLPDLFHVADAAEWAAGEYARSTRGLDLADVGFVHCAFAWQVQGVLDRFYADADGPLLLLRVDPALTGVPVRVEPPPGSPEGFPHVYGPLTPAAVVDQVVLPRTPGGWQAPPLR